MALSLLPRDNENGLMIPRANQACVACRKQKRKCTKELPTCELCTRMGRSCDYADSQPAPTAEDLVSLQIRLIELENKLNNRQALSPASSAEKEMVSVPSARIAPWTPSPANTFRTPLFLDLDVFKWKSMQNLKPNVEIPMEVLEILSRGNTVQEAATSYFETIHCWFPIVSKKRMNIGLPMWDAGPDLAMLFLAMKLVTALPGAGEGIRPAESPLYTAAKRFLALLEASGAVSLQYLQAMLLVAIYEMGHAIYPAAWMTVGACSRYADMIGIPSFRESWTVLGTCSTWTEAEERRRVWWGIFILDRTISLGSKKRFSAMEPTENDILPVHDDAWDAGDMLRAFQRPVSTPLAEPAGDFARLCQASVLINRNMKHALTTMRNTNLGITPPFDPDEVVRLLDEMTTFTQIIERDILPTDGASTRPCLLSCRTLVLSALMLLLDVYSCPESLRSGQGPNGFDSVARSPGELDMQVRAVNGLREAALKVRDLGVDHLLEDLVLPASLRRASPLWLDSLYNSMATLHWLWKESGEMDIQAALEDVKRCLVRMAMRWALANEYLAMESHHDVTEADAAAWEEVNQPATPASRW